MRGTAIDIRGVPDDIREAVNADAETRGVSTNDVVGGVLAARYGVPWTDSGYPSGAPRTGDHWNLRISVQMREALRGHAKAVGGTITGCVMLALAQHYGLPTRPPKRRGTGIDPQIVMEARARWDRGRGESLRTLSREYGVKRETLTKAIRGD